MLPTRRENTPPRVYVKKPYVDLLVVTAHSARLYSRVNGEESKLFFERGGRSVGRYKFTTCGQNNFLKLFKGLQDEFSLEALPLTLC